MIQPIENCIIFAPEKRNNNNINNILKNKNMKRVILFSLMALMTVAAFGRKHVENATVVADTIFYAENMSNVASAEQASYYRLLMRPAP